MDRSSLGRGLGDPYRELGVPRGANDDQIKAAHRRLAKRHHPDAPGGDTRRFLAVQEAYQLLSDPLRRRDWDRRHAPGPVQPGDGRTGRRGRPSGRWTREEGEAVRRPRQGRTAPGEAGHAPGAGTSHPGPGGAGPGSGPDASRTEHPAAGARGRSGRRPERAWSASDRDPASRTHTWSAAGVPWWEDFTPRSHEQDRPGTPAGPDAADGPRADGAGAASPSPPDDTDDRPRPDFDVYSRSSGAAWSMAARRHFRRGDADLPKGGSFFYRGTQVVTGAEARRARAEEEAFLGRRAQAAAPRQAFDHEAPSDPRPRPTAADAPSRSPGARVHRSQRGSAPQGPTPVRPATAPAAAASSAPTSSPAVPASGTSARPASPSSPPAPTSSAGPSATAAQVTWPRASSPTTAKAGRATRAGAIAGSLPGLALVVLGTADPQGLLLVGAALACGGAVAGAMLAHRLVRTSRP